MVRNLSRTTLTLRVVVEDVAVLKKSVAMIVLLPVAALAVLMGFALIHLRSKWSRLALAFPAIVLVLVSIAFPEVDF